ncbi:unnamed protein product [Paramecium sonneborni]|uniref:Uncharacterized protein n=1 Tax=Paramecium sonneborni TaxID=65129 RepID=A0A8S1RIB5_9CILI|nr:unnamed protein product [Paramecium sonneborni]
MSNNLSTSEIYNNAAALQMLLHALCKSVSSTDEEFNLKYDIYEASQIKYFRNQ